MKRRGLGYLVGAACRVEKINAYMFGEGKTAKEINDFEVTGAVGWVIHKGTDLRYTGLFKSL
jgi:hypothetical protein